MRPVVLGLISVLLAGCRCGAPADPVVPADRPNVLILMWDTVRADRMSVYGHERVTTPKLEAFAESARVYEQAVAPGMWTVPVHASLFTGRPVAEHGANARWIWLDGRFETMAERFSAEGYETWAWSANPYMSSASNLLQGFETQHLTWDGGWSEQCGRHTMEKRVPEDASVELGPAWDHRKQRGWPAHVVAYKDSGPVMVEAFEDWQDHREDRPWLAYINLLEAHHPRLPGSPAREQLLDAELVKAGLETDASLFRIMAAMEGAETIPEDELEAMRGVYDATLAELDEATASLFAALENRGELDDTIVVVVADHGEHLGEHGMFDHRWSVYEELLHVPLLIRYPEGVEPGRVTEPVGTIQLYATICELTGVTCPDLGPTLLEPAPERVFSELIQPTPRVGPIRKSDLALEPGRWNRRYQVVRDGRWKFVRASDGEHALYDLQADPGERTNLAASDPDRAATMLAAVKAWRSSLVMYDASERGPDDHPRPALKASPGTAEQLRQLGYTAGDEEAP